MKNSLIKNIIANLILMLSICIANAEIQISKQNYKKTPVSVEHFQFINEASRKHCITIRNSVKENLDRSGIFHVIEKNIDINDLFKFHVGKKINRDDNNYDEPVLTIKGAIKLVDEEKYQIQINIHDNILKKIISSKTFTYTSNSIKRLSNVISDQIYRNYTGEPGCFDSKITYIAYNVYDKQKFTRLAIMDHNGENHFFLSDGKFLTMSPKLSPDGSKLAYVDFRHGKSKIFIRNIYTGEEFILCELQGNIFSPRFAHKKEKILFSVAKGGSTNICEADVQNKSIRQVTNNAYINTSASYSRDDNSIIFTSDRSGAPQIYQMNLDGTNIERISTQTGSYSEPTYSPKGNLISAIKLYKRQFSLAIIDINTRKEKILITSPMIQGYCWSPNGHYILISREEPITKKSDSCPTHKLFQIDISGNMITPIDTPYSASDPCWSQ